MPISDREFEMHKQRFDFLTRVHENAFGQAFKSSGQAITLLHISNGGALIALLALLGATFGADPEYARETANSLIAPGVLLVLGVVLAALTSAGSYHNAFGHGRYMNALYNAEWQYGSRDNWSDEAAEEVAAAEKATDTVRYCAIFSAYGSLACFGVGAIWAIIAIARSAPVT